MFWGSNKNKNKVSFLIDLRSSSIGYALIESNSVVSFFKSFDRKHIFLNQISDTNLLIEEFYKNLKGILDKNFLTDQKLRDSVDEVCILLGSPWYEAKYKNLAISNQNIKITKNFIEETITKSITKDSDQVQIEKIISNFKIDGYDLNNPINKKFNNFEFSVFESFVDSDAMNRIETTLKTYFKKAKLNFHTHPTVANATIKRHYPDISNYLTFDVAGEITEMNLVLNNKIVGFFYIPYGSHAFIREIMNQCNYNEQTAFSKLNLISEGHTDVNCQTKEQNIFTEFSNIWLSKIKKVLDDNNIQSTPSNIFILADQEVRNQIKESIDKPEGYAGSLKNNIKPFVRILDYNSDEGTIKFQESRKRDSVLNIFADFVRIHS